MSLRTAYGRLRAVFSGRSLERDMDREMRAHLELLSREYEAAGMSPEDARMAALRRFGNAAHLKERGRDVRGPGLLGDVLRDARYAVRGFARTPGFTAALVLILALGIGANSGIFSVMDALLFGDLPYPEGEELVAVYAAVGDAPYNVASPENWVDWQQSPSFASLAAWMYGGATLTGEGEASALTGQLVSAEFLPLLGVEPLLGRVFTPEDDEPDAERVVILSHGLWQQRFGGDPEILGRTIDLNAAPHEVVGVMPPGFSFLSANGPTVIDYWMPFGLNRSLPSGGRYIFTVGRLGPGITPEGAQSELSALAGRIADERGYGQDVGVTVAPLRADRVRDVRTSLIVLFAAVGALVVLACFNVAGLLLARGVRRRHEMAIRVSLGASRSSIARQLLTEGCVLALAGAGAGLLVSRWTVRGLAALAPINVLETFEPGLDGRVLLYTFGLSLATAIVFTLVPAVTSGRESLGTHLAAASRTFTRTMRLRQGLVIAQVALALMLASGAGLLGRTLQELLGGDIGLSARSVLTLPVALPAARYDTSAQAAFFREAVERLESLPGVESAGAERTLPVTGIAFTMPFHVEGTPELLPPDQLGANESATALVRIATPGYFQALGVPVVRGRTFSADDQRESAPAVFVVNQAFVRTYFPESDPIGEPMSVFNAGSGPQILEGQIVGVVGDVREGSLRREARPTIFSDHSHAALSFMTVFLRADRPEGLPASARQVIREIDPNLPVTPVWLEDALAGTVSRDRMNAVVLGTFAATALFLAAFGLYGLLVYLVAGRKREIGIRMALGAETRAVLLSVVAQGMRLVVPGVVLGLAGALALSRSFGSLLYGVAPYDPTIFAPVVVLILAVAALAIWAPARHATRVDPQIALREE